MAMRVAQTVEQLISLLPPLTTCLAAPQNETPVEFAGGQLQHPSGRHFRTDASCPTVHQ